MTDRIDSRLAEDFGRLKREDAEGAPDFDAMLRTARQSAEENPVVVPLHRRSVVRLGAAAATLAAAALAGVLLFDGSDPDQRFEAVVASYSGEAGASRWSAPTDGLLKVPGMEFLSTVPSIGGGVGSIGDPTVSPEETGNDA